MLVEDFFGPAFFITLIILISINVLWQIPKIDRIIQFLFGTKPNIHGTWQGRLSYEFEGRKLEKIVYLVIKQTSGYSIDIGLLTNERTSSSTFAEIESYKGGQRIYYTYEVEDSSKNKERNPLHNGFCQLNFDLKNSPNAFHGIYYTSRKTVGDFDFTKRCKKVVMNYREAKKLFV
jgi:hypothetical protein